MQQTTMIHKAALEPVDPIAWKRLAVSSRNVAIYIEWLCRETTEQIYIINYEFAFLQKNSKNSKYTNSLYEDKKGQVKEFLW